MCLGPGEVLLLRYVFALSFRITKYQDSSTCVSNDENVKKNRCLQLLEADTPTSHLGVLSTRNTLSLLEQPNSVTYMTV